MAIKKSWACFIVLFIVVMRLGIAQDYRGKGRVMGFVYSQNGEPLEGVDIKLIYAESQTGFMVRTDQSGRWQATWLRSGMWHIDFEKVGYVPYRMAIKLREHERNPDIIVRMQKMDVLVISDDLKRLVDEGNRLYEIGRLEEAIKVFNDTLINFPEAYAINKNIGNVYFRMEKYDEAITYYMKVLEKNARDYESMMLIGNCYSNKGEEDRAMEWYRKIPIKDIDDPIVLFNIGTAFYEKSMFTEAMEYYQRALEIKNGLLDALYQLGLTYAALGNYKEAITAFEIYVKKDPDSEKAKQAVHFLEFLKKNIKAREN